jgi:hypothetical protein
MQLSARAQIRYSQARGGFLFGDLLALVLPGLRVIYAGILPLILALLALLLKRQRETIFWGIMALLALLISLGGKTLVFTLLYLFVPGFRFLQGQEGALQVFSLAVAILAGYGMAILDRPMIHTVKHRYATICCLLRWATIGAVILAILAFWGSLLNIPESGQVNDLLERSVLLVLLLALSTVALHLRLNRKLRGWRLGLLLIPLIVFDLFSLNMGQDLQRARARERFRPPPVVQFLQGQPGPFRIWHEDQLPGNYGTVWRLEDTGGISRLRLERYERFLNTLPSDRARSLLNVQYALTREQALPDGELVAEFSNPEQDTYLYRIDGAAPAAYVVYSAQIEANDAAALQRLASPDFDPRQEVILAKSPELALPGVGSATVQIVERVPNRLVLEVDTDADGVLVLSEIAYPGWEATVDGRQTPILRANTVLRALPLQAGQHSVELVFRPWTVYMGLAISLLTLIVVLIAVPVLLRSEKRGTARIG